MTKVAVVLLVLASFVMAMTTVSMAATPTVKPMATMAKPTMGAMPKATMKAPAVPGVPAKPNTTVAKSVMPAATMKAPAAPTVKKMFDITPMKSTISNTYRMLKNTVKMPGKSSTGNGVKSKANKIFGDTYGKIGMSAGQPLQLGVPAPKALDQLGTLPKIANTKATIGEAPGANLLINLGIGL